ncbi:GNAT family N-acetyltransferase [Xanthobacter sp. TB0136]|uniref:GNAT family N-acetyltransferase n=1 Tax=Xanthobacter sp. TB0136 TaxID=3459177 RepID=UPI0040395989
MKLRGVEERDMPAITAIYDVAVTTGTASFETEPPGLAEMVQRQQALCAAGYPFLVAERQGHVLGYAYAGTFRPRMAYRHVVENSIYVDEAAQRCGVGRALLDALIAECTARGFRQMVAVIGGADNEGSIALHRACGFHMAGTLPATGFKFGRWIDTLLMQRALGEGAQTPP